jgi:hypothetical protein
MVSEERKVRGKEEEDEEVEVDTKHKSAWRERGSIDCLSHFFFCCCIPRPDPLARAPPPPLHTHTHAHTRTYVTREGEGGGGYERFESRGATARTRCRWEARRPCAPRRSPPRHRRRERRLILAPLSSHPPSSSPARRWPGQPSRLTVCLCYVRRCLYCVYSCVCVVVCAELCLHTRSDVANNNVAKKVQSEVGPLSSPVLHCFGGGGRSYEHSS